jgi:hypothetical protein
VRRRSLIRRVVCLVLLAALVPVVFSYATTMMKPSSLPLWPRTVEGIRANHGSWLVDEVEHYSIVNVSRYSM